MSDGALSQDEIDALLAGVDSSGIGGGSSGNSGGFPAQGTGPSMSSPAASGGSDADRQILSDFLASTVTAQASNLSMMTGSAVSIKGPQAFFSNQDNFLSQLPDRVAVVKADFNSGFPGEHIYIMPETTARSVAGLINKEDNIELDEMAMSVLGEAVGTIIGSQITALTGKTGNKSISNIPPAAANVPKAAAALPAGDFFCAAYQVDLGDGKSNQFWEIMGSSVASDIARSLGGGASMSMPANNMGMASMAMGGMNSMQGMPNMAGMQNMAGMSPGMGNMAGMQSMGAMAGNQANVQAVQFPNLMPRVSSQEQGNIGLIMDVFMEMTVELGRTRKLIKEILGMGEGTIIELDKLAGEPVDILVNHKLIAKGEVVVIDENFGVRVTEIVSPMERMSDMG
ncbi:MAG: flagellar motor switch protein FliN [Treponema sp.]|nr:flagellar motor switch protein FliN [Treponema sp.]